MEIDTSGQLKREEFDHQPKFELVDVKTEPDDDEESSAATEGSETPPAYQKKKRKQSPPLAKRKSVEKRYRSSKHTQVSWEDFEDCPRDDFLRDTAEDVPILNANSQQLEPQCRLCLRKVPQNALRLADMKLKSKIKNVFRMKIFLQDSYPFICSNCVNLIDIFYNFKDAVLKAKVLLTSERICIENDFWQSPGHTEAIATCQAIVTHHKTQIDALYDDFKTRTKKEASPEPEPTAFEPDYILTVFENESDPAAETTNEPVPEASGIGDETVNLKTEYLEFDDTSAAHDGNTDYDSDDYKPLVKRATKSKATPKKRGPKPKNKESLEKTPKKRGGRRKKNEEGGPKPQSEDVLHSLCDFCGERVHAQTIEAHMNQHLGLKPYSCPIEGCDLTFGGKYHQIRHIRRMHGEKGVETHECDTCGKIIRGPRHALKYHQQRHKAEKKYICQVCGKAFTMAWYLTQHSIIHSEKFPYKCNYCGKEFKFKASMKTHEKNVHEKKMELQEYYQPQQSDAHMQ
ncbi:zinc finger protein 37-like [Uranotaenia lowii]|uniref:zinc finger protein 37-like n=1 Tax=Uranotaenia lowii TaxID=190385 RepID=UPI00247960BE|nr:zinc finger protein 37-like [Uranotaenia lowii]XP_055595187.1 zinc finger protein 37-like [Uranotaenia lowii]XP_055595188.1 zinc finger protein 37-like [Uranotaenia lowii]XP_055595189.1 zinc finger protein 37-like [Uranotaenia lowii]